MEYIHVPKAVDLLLGADVFGRVVLHDRRFGPSGSPSAFKTQFGLILTGTTGHTHGSRASAGSCYLATTIKDQQGSNELLRKFWVIETPYFQEPSLSIEERTVVEHFNKAHYKGEKRMFVVLLPLKDDAVPLGESRTNTVHSFKVLERSCAKNQFEEFAACIYFELGHAEPVPTKEMNHENYYMSMHAVRKDSSTTTKLRVVFDAFAETDSGSSLNDQFLVGPTVHPSLIDVLIRSDVTELPSRPK